MTMTETMTEYHAEEWVSRRKHWKKWLFRIDVRHLYVGDPVMVNLFMGDVVISGDGSRLHEATPRKIKKIKTNEEFSTVSIKVRHYIFNYWHTFLHPEEQVFLYLPDARGSIRR
jgi:hypothetical protein